MYFIFSTQWKIKIKSMKIKLSLLNFQLVIFISKLRVYLKHCHTIPNHHPGIWEWLFRSILPTKSENQCTVLVRVVEFIPHSLTFQTRAVILHSGRQLAYFREPLSLARYWRVLPNFTTPHKIVDEYRRNNWGKLTFVQLGNRLSKVLWTRHIGSSNHKP
jgi:hypothetical protein